MSDRLLDRRGWALRMAALVVAATAFGCPTYGTGRTTYVTGGPGDRPPPPPCIVGCVAAGGPATGERNRVSLLVRSFLPRGEREESRYVFHAYLFFADNGSGTRSIRLAASAAVLHLFNDAREASGLDVDPLRFAALHVPVCSREAAAWIVGGPQGRIPDCARDGEARYPPEQLLASYDYDRVRLIKRRVEDATRRSLPRVALLGYPTPLGDAGTVDPSQLYIIDLERLAAGEVADHIAWFRDALESKHGVHDAVPSAADQARNFFAAAGTVMSRYPGEP